MLHYIVCIWNNGAFVNCTMSSFGDNVNKLVSQYGPPDVVYLRRVDKDYSVTDLKTYLPEKEVSKEE